jgi:hypothetical protein
MNQPHTSIDSTLFRHTLNFVKQTNELTELLLNITPTDYKLELNIAKDMILNQEYELSKVINDLQSQSIDVPPVYQQLFKANQVLLRLITLIPTARQCSRLKKINHVQPSNGTQQNTSTGY